MRIRKKNINGKEYYYAQIDIRLEKGKRKSYSLYLGTKKPGDLRKVEERLYTNIFEEFFPKKKTIFLDKKIAVRIELARRKFNLKFEKFSKTDQENINENEIVDFVYTTLITEGVHVSREDVETAFDLMTGKIKKILLDERIKISVQMIQGVREISKKKQKLTLRFLLDIHKTIMQGFQDKSPGEFRNTQVVILKATPTRPYGEEIKFKPPNFSEIKKLLKEFLKWINANKNKLTPIELAALTHLKFYRIHPFKDGNKRICRLLLNKILLDNNYPVLNVSKDRESYFGALIDSVEQKDDKLFVDFLATTFIEQYGKGILGLTRNKK